MITNYKIEQEKIWNSRRFGKFYTKLLAERDIDEWHKKIHGITMTELNQEFLKDLPKDSRILEVGCGIGRQLRILREMGFHNLYGMDVNSYAIKYARKYVRETGKTAIYICGSALDIPFEHITFDLVFTHATLEHIPPEHIDKAISEIYRCSNKYIYGWEYYNKDGFIQIPWRERQVGNDFTWGADYVGIFQKQFPNLTLVKDRFFNDGRFDFRLYLLEKKGK